MTKTDKTASKLGVITSYILNKLWTVIAVCLVVFALLISLLRYSLQYLNEHKEYVQDYIANEYAIELSIGELSASWKTNGPAIVLRNVNIAKSEDSPIALHATEVLFEIDFWPTLSSAKLQSHQVVLNKLDLVIDTTQIEASQSDYPIVDALENVFLEQLSNFTVSNSRLTLISSQNSKAIDIEKLSWTNKRNRHQGVGEFALDDVSDNSASFILDLYGDVESYSGTLFAQAHDIDLSAWINEFTELDNQLTASKGNMEVWARIDSGKIARVDGQLFSTSFSWKTNKADIDNVVKAKFSAIKNEQQWNFSIADLTIDTQQEKLKTTIDGYVTAQQTMVMRMTTPAALASVMPLAGLFSQSLADQLALIKMNANLEEFTARIDESGTLVTAKLDKVSWQEHNEIVGISDLTANVYWKNKKGKIIFNASDAQLLSSYYFARNLPILEANIPVWIDTTNDTKVTIDNASLAIDGLSLTINGDYAVHSQFLSLLVDVDPLALLQVPKFLPSKLIDDGTHTFLSNAFTSKGKIKGAHVLYHGGIHDFPFDNNDGVFQSSVAIEQGDFTFSDGWPALTQLEIDLKFENQSLVIQGPSSFLNKVKLTNLRAEIPSLTKNATLSITADCATNSQDVTDLMLHSSLADSLGNLLANDVQITGKLSTQLGLYIPISNAANTRAKGEVFLRGNQVSIPAIKLALHDAHGSVVFDNEKIDIKNLNARLLDQAVQVDVHGAQDGANYKLETKINGNWQVAPLAQKVSQEFAAFFTGNTAWSLDVSLDLLKNDFTYNAVFTSDFKGIEANIPAPFGKTKEDTRTLRLVSQGDRIASSVTLNFADVVNFDGALPHQEMQFNRAYLALGSTKLNNRGLGFSISANVDTLSLDDWFPFVQALTANLDSASTSIITAPKRIFIDANKLIVAQQLFTGVDLVAKRLDDQWAIDIDSNEILGGVSIFDDWYSKGLVINAEYLNISKNEQSTASDKIKTLEPKDLPSISFTCKACNVYGFNLGRVDITAHPNSDGLELTQLIANTAQGKISASGQWYKRNQDNYTFIAGGLDAINFGGFIKQLGFDTGIQDSSAHFTYALKWKDSPIGFDFKNLDGQIKWELTDGYLTELSDQGSRIFTFLSLSSLVRKLSLDFRDVFAKGFFYDSMQGSIQITQGIADTRDTIIDGAAGEIEIYGYTDLANQALNYNINFTPNVTGNLPILVYFMVNPPTALAALALDKMLTSAKVISNVNYLITGTIKDPIMTETGRKSTEVELPTKRDADGKLTEFPFTSSNLQEQNKGDHGQSN